MTAKETGTTPQHRMLSLDWLRGFVMILMAWDHASMFFNRGRFAKDMALVYKGGAIDTWQYLGRWLTHLCAPTFAFLMGTAIALKIARDIEKEVPSNSIDRYLLIRGGLLVGLDLTLFSLGAGRIILQVLFALGTGMIALVVLRRLSVRWLLLGTLTWFAASEAITLALWSPASGHAPLYLAPLIGIHLSNKAVIIYPALHWLAIVSMGWCFGHYIIRRKHMPQRIASMLLGCGVVGVLLSLAVRGLNGYGNMLMYRQTDATNHPLVQWLLTSKYPPSMSFIAMELGIMALLLALVMFVSQKHTPHINGPVLVFGQTALFFYLLHFLLLSVAGGIVRGKPFGIPGAIVVALAVLVVLYPICRWYRSYKSRHPNSIARWI